MSKQEECRARLCSCAGCPFARRLGLSSWECAGAPQSGQVSSVLFVPSRDGRLKVLRSRTAISERCGEKAECLIEGTGYLFLHAGIGDPSVILYDGTVICRGPAYMARRLDGAPLSEEDADRAASAARRYIGRGGNESTVLAAGQAA